MKRSFSNRFIDFTGRMAFGGEGIVMKDRRLFWLLIVLGAVSVFGKVLWLVFVMLGVMIAATGYDWVQYNRKHGNG